MSFDFPSPIRAMNRDQKVEFLFHNCHGKMVIFAAKSMSRDAAEDVVQDAFEMMIPNIDNIAPEALSSYFRTTVLNKIRDRYRRNGRIHFSSLDLALENDDDKWFTVQIRDESPSVTRLIEKDCLQDKVRHVVAALPPHHQRVVVEHYFHGRELTEISRITGVTTGTIKSRLARARENMKRRLQETVID
jgi:RNA polymerase sigma-70 factor (ECF subfamily)